ncbi:hypothetical protein [Parvibaculum sp. MBR-TMA-1.3b-4.2]|jgi:hypothetical protein
MDMHHNLASVQTLDPAVTTEARAGAPVDIQGFHGVEHIVAIGASGDSLSETDRLDLVLEVSEDGSSWEAVSEGGDILGSVDAGGVFASIDAASKEQSEYRIGYVGSLRYSRIRVVPEGTHDEGTPVAALALLGGADVKPV